MTSTPLPSTGAVTGLKETLDFFGDPSFTQQRFEQYGDVFETRLLAQRMVFIRNEHAIGDLLSQGDALEGSGRKACGSYSATAPWPIAAALPTEPDAAWWGSCSQVQRSSATSRPSKP